MAVIMSSNCAQISVEVWCFKNYINKNPKSIIPTIASCKLL